MSKEMEKRPYPQTGGRLMQCVIKALLACTLLLAGPNTLATAEPMPVIKMVNSGIFCTTVTQTVSVLNELENVPNLTQVINSPSGEGCGWVLRPVVVVITPLVEYKTKTHVINIVEFYIPKLNVKQYGWNKVTAIKSRGEPI